MTWQPDPTRRHQERWIESGIPTSRVRDHGVENADPLPPDAPGRPATTTGAWATGPTPRRVPSTTAPTMAVSHPDQTAGAAATVAPTLAVPGLTTPTHVPLAPPPESFGSPAPTAVPSASLAHPSTPRSSAALSPTGQRGIPAGLALATVIAAFPMLALLVTGLLAIAAGQDISGASSSSTVQSWDYDEWDIKSSTTPSQDMFGVGNATSEAGAKMAAIGAVGLLAAVAMATGSNAGRVLTAFWLLGATIWLLTQMESAFEGEALPYAAVVISPPIIALLGMFTARANLVFTRD